PGSADPGAFALSGGVHPWEEFDHVGPFQLRQLLEADSAHFGHDARRVDHPRWSHLALAASGSAPGSISLDQQAVGGDPSSDVAKFLAAATRDQARKGDVEAEIEEAAGPPPPPRPRAGNSRACGGRTRRPR